MCPVKLKRPYEFPSACIYLECLATPRPPTSSISASLQLKRLSAFCSAFQLKTMRVLPTDSGACHLPTADKDSSMFGMRLGSPEARAGRLTVLLPARPPDASTREVARRL